MTTPKGRISQGQRARKRADRSSEAVLMGVLLPTPEAKGKVQEGRRQAQPHHSTAMDQENFQIKGFFGILGFSIRLIHSRRRLFLSLAASILLPLAALSMAGHSIDYGPDGHHRSISADESCFLIVHSIVYLFFILFAAGAAIHAAASAYASKEAATLHRSLFRAAPRSLDGLLDTSKWGVVLTIVYSLVSQFVFSQAIALAKATSGSAKALRIMAKFFGCAVGVERIMGIVLVSIIWYVAIAATVLEGTPGPDGSSGCRGIEATRKARALVRGRAIVCGVLMLLVKGLIYAFESVCWALVLYIDWIPLVARILLGAFILLANTGLFLLGMTVLTVAYLVLKASHSEPIDPVSLTATLNAWAGEYESGDVKMIH